VLQILLRALIPSNKNIFIECFDEEQCISQKILHTLIASNENNFI
jgi:hypothetical protein